MTSTTLGEGFQIAVLLPCHNVAATIGPVVRGFAAALPGARIYVFDNNSTDDTAREAAHAGARVFREWRQGEAAVVRRMFADIEADIYLMAGGDGNSDPADAPSLVNALITEHVDMVVGARSRPGEERGRAGRGGGQSRDAAHLGGDGLVDPASNYRAFTRRFVKSFPAMSDRLGIAAAMSVHASQLMVPVAEIELSGEPAAVYDGAAQAALPGAAARVAAVATLMKETRPFAFYGLLAAALGATGAMLLLAGISSWQSASVAAYLPNIVLGTGLVLLAALMVGLGLIEESLNRSRIEQKRILFLAVPGLGAQ